MAMVSTKSVLRQGEGVDEGDRIAFAVQLSAGDGGSGTGWSEILTEAPKRQAYRLDAWQGNRLIWDAE
jgi:hypothetical protein